MSYDIAIWLPRDLHLLHVVNLFSTRRKTLLETKKKFNETRYSLEKVLFDSFHVKPLGFKLGKSMERFLKVSGYISNGKGL